MEQYVDAGVAADLTEILQKDNPDWYKSFKDGIFDKLTYDEKLWQYRLIFRQHLSL